MRSVRALVDIGPALGVQGRAIASIQRLKLGPGVHDAEPLMHPALVVSGVLTRSVRLRQREGALLYGPGDVLPGEAAETSPFTSAVRAFTPSLLAVFDPVALASLAGTPAAIGAIVERVTQQCDRAGLQTILYQLPSIEERLATVLPELSERLGTVTAEGVTLPAYLSHAVLAALIGVRRPSLTTALSDLPPGLLSRLDDGRWLLAHEHAGLAVA